MKKLVVASLILGLYSTAHSHHVTEQEDPHVLKFFEDWRVAESTGLNTSRNCFITSAIKDGDSIIGWVLFTFYEDRDDEEFSITLEPGFNLREGLDKSRSSFVGSLYSKYWLISERDSFWLEKTYEQYDLTMDHFAGGLFLSLVGKNDEQLRYDLSQNGAKDAYDYARDICLRGADMDQKYFD